MRRLIIFLVLFTIVSITEAQTPTPDDGWEIVERCVDEPTAPPEDWSYDGTIIMSGYAGLHGMRSDWETPRVLARISPFYFWDGAVSPDAHHFTVINRIQETYGTGAQITVNQIGVFDTTENRGDYEIYDWSEQYGIGSQGLAIRVLRWLNNEEFIFEQGSEGAYQVVIFNIESEEMRNWDYPINPISREPFIYPSPDWQIAIGTNPSLQDWDAVDISSGDIIYEEEGILALWDFAW